MLHVPCQAAALERELSEEHAEEIQQLLNQLSLSQKQNEEHEVCVCVCMSPCMLVAWSPHLLTGTSDIPLTCTCPLCVLLSDCFSL